MAAQLTALCALSAAVELLLGDAAERRGVRFLIGLMALLKEAGFDKVGLKTEAKPLGKKK